VAQNTCTENTNITEEAVNSVRKQHNWVTVHHYYSSFSSKQPQRPSHVRPSLHVCRPSGQQTSVTWQ